MNVLYPLLHDMTINTLNSKINLPSIVSKLGIPTADYDFVRVPMFGWYARSKSTDFIGNIFDFFEPDHWPRLLSILDKDFADCFDFKLPYSTYAEKKLFKDQKRFIAFQSAWILSKKEAQSHRVRFDSQVQYIGDVLDAAGMPALLANEVGYLSDNVIKMFPELDLSMKQRYQKVLLFPTFCTPKHICSLEVCRMKAINDLELVYENGERGWYGQYNTEVLQNIQEMKVKTGFLWDHKVDHWNTNIIKMSETVDTPQLIKIWSEAHKTGFAENPVDMLLGKQGSADVKHHVAALSFSQIQELEKKTGEKLLDYWLRSKEQQFVVHGQTFMKRGTAYFVINTFGEEEQLTNFCIEIDEIVKRENNQKSVFYWCGHIHYHQEVIPFEVDDKSFSSGYLFTKGIRQIFLELGIGIPFINERYVRQLLSLIQLSCHQVKIVH